MITTSRRSQANDAGTVVVASLTSMAVVLVVTAFAVVGAAPPAEVTQSQRVQAQGPEPAGQPSPVCPQMDNPGGRLEWAPSANPGPTPTNGKVVIPALGVDAPIVRVGVDSGYKMVVPGNARDIAWLDQGGIPGFTQNVVLAGHISHNRQAGSFSRLIRLQPGELVDVWMDDRKLTYRVVWNCSFPRDTERAEQIMGYTHTESITLITCGGTFDRAAGTHTNRIVVRAERVYDA